MIGIAILVGLLLLALLAPFRGADSRDWQGWKPESRGRRH